jgi:hypothetical protein
LRDAAAVDEHTAQHGLLCLHGVGHLTIEQLVPIQFIGHENTTLKGLQK